MKRDLHPENFRIGYLVNQYPKVSHSFIRREIHALERLGVEVRRFALRGWDAELVDAEDLLERDKTRYLLRQGVAGLLAALLLTALRAPRRFAGALRMTLRLARRSDRPGWLHLASLAEACELSRQLRGSGVLHLHAHFGTNSAEVAMLTHALCRVPYSFTVHGPEEFDKPQFIGLREKVSQAAFVVAISSHGRSQLLRWSDYRDWGKLHVVHCGLDKDYRCGPVPAPQGSRLVCVGRLCEQKGQLLLVEAAAALARSGLEFELVLAGDGEMRGEIESAIARHGLQSRIRITGWISGEQVRRELMQARALVLPSLAEGLPVVIMEAMALGRPVLSTYIAGIPELVVHGQTGWLIPAGSAGELAEAMAACLATPPDRLAGMGEAARERVLARHDIDREAMKLAALCQAAIHAHRPMVQTS